MTEEEIIVEHAVEPAGEPVAEVGEDLVAEARRARFRAALSVLGDASARDLIRWILLPAAVVVIVGFNLMIFGWWGAARTAREIEQIPYLISGGLIGLGLVVVGGLLIATALWASITGRMARESDERHRAEMAALEARLDQLGAQVAAAVERAAGAANGPAKKSASRTARKSAKKSTTTKPAGNRRRDE